MIIGIPAFVLSALSLVWAIVGLFKPGALFFTSPDLRRRKHAVCFPLLMSLTFFLIMAAAAGAGLFAVILAGVLAFFTMRYWRKLSGHRLQIKGQSDTLARQNDTDASAGQPCDKQQTMPDGEAEPQKAEDKNYQESEPHFVEVWNSRHTGKYTLDVINCTCSCSDWQECRADAPSGTPYRLCKHLVEYFSQKDNCPEWLLPYNSIIFERHLKHRGMPTWSEHGTEAGQCNSGSYIMSAYPEKYPWINILTRMGEYGYNVVERRWARGKMPLEESFFVGRAKKLSKNALKKR